MATIDLSGAGFPNLDIATASSATSPLSQYAAWASTMGVSSTGTDYAFSGDNSIASLNYGTKLFAAQTGATLHISTEGAILLYKTALSAGASASFMTVPNITLMLGYTDAPELLMSWHPRGANAAVGASAKMRSSGGVSILYFPMEISGSPGVNVGEVAVKIGLDLVEIVGTTISGNIDYYLTCYDAADTLFSQALALAQAPGATDSIVYSTASAGTPVNVSPSLLSQIFSGKQPFTVVGIKGTPTTANSILNLNIPDFGLQTFVSVPNQSVLSGNNPAIISGMNITAVSYVAAGLGYQPGGVELKAVSYQGALKGKYPLFGNIIKILPAVVGRKYFVVLSGVADGLNDVTISISNLSFRHAKGKKSTANITIPNGGYYLHDIQSRPNGTINIHEKTIYNDGSEIDSISSAFSIISLASSQGSKRFSITMQLSSPSQNNNSPSQYTLIGESFISTDANGNMRVRSTPIAGIMVGDTALMSNGFILNINKITKTISSTLVSMEISNG